MPTAEQPDQAWGEIEREHRDVVRDLIVQPALIDLQRLLRSTAFNPQDVWISPAQRTVIGVILAEAENDLATLTAGSEIAFARELAAAQAQDRVRTLDLARQPGDLATFGLGRRPLLREVDGRTIAIARSDMNETCRMLDEVHRAGAALTRRLASAFVAIGVMSHEEASGVVSRARRMVTAL